MQEVEGYINEMQQNYITILFAVNYFGYAALNIYYLADSGLQREGRWELRGLQHEQTYFNACYSSKAYWGCKRR
jgi:hypothetical protein